MLIEKERIAVRKCKDDFLLLIASTTGMVRISPLGFSHDDFPSLYYNKLYYDNFSQFW
jgi:hypothetical protein